MSDKYGLEGTQNPKLVEDYFKFKKEKELQEQATKTFEQQLNPDTTEFESFFHYTDEKLFSAGFQKGYEYAIKKLTE